MVPASTLLFAVLWLFALVVGIFTSIATGFFMQMICRDKLRVRLFDLVVGLLAAICGDMSSTVLLFYQRRRGRSWFDGAPPILGWAGAHPLWAGVIATVASVSILYAVREVKLHRRRLT